MPKLSRGDIKKINEAIRLLKNISGPGVTYKNNGITIDSLVPQSQSGEFSLPIAVLTSAANSSAYGLYIGRIVGPPRVKIDPAHAVTNAMIAGPTGSLSTIYLVNLGEVDQATQAFSTSYLPLYFYVQFLNVATNGKLVYGMVAPVQWKVCGT